MCAFVAANRLLACKSFIYVKKKEQIVVRSTASTRLVANSIADNVIVCYDNRKSPKNVAHVMTQLSGAVA